MTEEEHDMGSDSRKRTHSDDKSNRGDEMELKRPRRTKGHDKDERSSQRGREDKDRHSEREQSNKGDKDRREKKDRDEKEKERKHSRRDRSSERVRRTRRNGKDDRDRNSKDDRERSERNKDFRTNFVNAEDENGLEEGEVADPPKVLTARDIERQRLLQEELLKEGEEEVSEKKPVWSMGQAQIEKESRQCPYLDTIDRSVLDFDFEKLCSVSLSTLNVYACMICGKYFQGRGTSTHAYTHSLDVDHRVYLNLQTLKFYCLPDNYEICDPSLEDIKYVLKPTYTKQLIASLDRQSRMARAYDDSTYYPGVVGLNNIKANDYCNVVLHALSHVIPLRNYFLQEENYINIHRPPGDIMSELPKRFGELIRKLWNPRAFRKHVSPHEMLQATVLCSNKQFQFIKQSDAADFLNFLLNTLHSALNGNQKTSSSIIYKTFRGRMKQYCRKVIPTEATDEQRSQLVMLPEYQETSKELPFIYLTLDLPPAPLYRDEQLANVIPQVPLHTLLMKFNGITEKEYKTYNDNILKRFELLRLPEYLIITYKRFHKNQWFVEKNPTIVTFPITNVDFYDCLSSQARVEHKYTTYDLLANIVHDGQPDNGSYRVQLLHQGSQKWFELEDLHVKEILPHVIVLAEAYIQVWRLNRQFTRDQRISEDMDTPVPSS